MNQAGEEVKTSEYIFWDSENPLEDQKDDLNKKLQSSLKCFDLNNITEGNEIILEKAKQLREEVDIILKHIKDLVEMKIITPVLKDVFKTEFKQDTKD